MTFSGKYLNWDDNKCFLMSQELLSMEISFYHAEYEKKEL